jgi:choline dehydrogenase-like flavoprotein
MIKKLREVKSFEHDFVIIGAGPAGITVALELEKYKKTVLLLEGGGLEYSEESQSLYNGQTIGNKNFNIKLSRVRYFGGSSNHWGGMCRPFSK